MIKYIDFVIASFISRSVRPGDVFDEIAAKPFIDNLCENYLLIENYTGDFKPALDFILKRSEVFTVLTPYEQVLDKMLNNSNELYFPEIKEYFFQINPEITDEEYESLFDFWRAYQTHITGKKLVSGLADFIGVRNVKVIDKNKDARWGLIGFKGSPGNTIEIESVISAVNDITKTLGFNMMMEHMEAYELVSKSSLIITRDPSIEFFIGTLAGSIYPFGKPDTKGPIGNHLRSV